MPFSCRIVYLKYNGFLYKNGTITWIIAGKLSLTTENSAPRIDLLLSCKLSGRRILVTIATRMAWASCTLPCRLPLPNFLKVSMSDGDIWMSASYESTYVNVWKYQWTHIINLHREDWGLKCFASIESLAMSFTAPNSRMWF